MERVLNMKFNLRLIFFYTGLLFLLSCAFSSYASPKIAEPVVGKWRHLKMVQMADGVLVRTIESTEESTLEYKADGTWRLVSPRNSNSGTYRFINDGALETTILQSSISKQIGWTSVKNISVDKNVLTLVTKYDEKSLEAFSKHPDGSRPKEMLVTSTFERLK